MSELVLVRIDDRLIHGQVVVKWLRYLACNEVVIVDDELWNDEDLQSVLCLAAPPGVNLGVAPVDQAFHPVYGLHTCLSCAGGTRTSSCTVGSRMPIITSAGRGRRILVLVKTPRTALALLENGLAFRELNVGGLAGGVGTTRVYRSISVTPEQVQILQEIGSRGVRVFFQTVPDERALELSELVPIHQSAD
jgi:mannose/fructose/N-acetylgalactosamine-specific phosphotransferase system component IIB